MPFTPWLTPFTGWSPTSADTTPASSATSSNRRPPAETCSSTSETSILSVNISAVFFFFVSMCHCHLAFCSPIPPAGHGRVTYVCFSFHSDWQTSNYFWLPPPIWSRFSFFCPVIFWFSTHWGRSNNRSSGSAGPVQQGRRRLRQLQLLSVSASRQQVRLRAHRWLERFVSVTFSFLFPAELQFLSFSLSRRHRLSSSLFIAILWRHLTLLYISFPICLLSLSYILWLPIL